MEPYRIFLSYSHEDRKLAEKLVGLMKNRGLIALWDKNIRPGAAFTEAIKGLIAHAHIFMPLITETSTQRPWVHQETGYAMALNIPVLPLAKDKMPAEMGEMITQLQALIVDVDSPDFDTQLDSVDFEQLIMSHPRHSTSMVQVAEWPEKRVELLAQYANRVIELGYYGRLMQRGGLSSFSIPDFDEEDPRWKIRDGEIPRSDFYHHWLRKERQALEWHAQQMGCDLLIDPTVPTSGYTSEAKLVRLESLLEFLNSMSDDKVRIVCSPRARDANITIIGDWFLAESRLRRHGEGWGQTIFHWHAPTVRRSVRAFQDMFNSLLSASGIPPEDTRRKTIERIQKIIVELKTTPPNKEHLAVNAMHQPSKQTGESS